MKLVISILLIFLASLFLFVSYDNSQYDTLCEDVEIIEIVSAKHRGVKVLLSNNKLSTVYQPQERIQKGSPYKYCERIEIS